MANAIEFGIRITADGRVAVVAADGVKRSFEGVTKSAREASSSIDGLSGVVRQMAAIAGPTVLVKSLFDAQVAADRLKLSLATTFGGQANAGREIEYVTKLAASLGLELNSTSESYARLTAASKGTSLEGAATRQIFEAVANASVKLGLSASESEGALRAIQQMMSKGTVQAEELRGQLGERLPGAVQIMARALNVSTAELGKMLERGEVLSAEVLPKFAAELERTFGGPPMITATSELNKLSTTWELFKRSINDAGVGAVFISVLQDARNWLVEIQGAFGAVFTYIERFRIAREMGVSIADANRIATSSQEELEKVLGATNDRIVFLQGLLANAAPWQVMIGATGRWAEDLKAAQTHLVALQSVLAQMNLPQNSDRWDRFLRGAQGQPVGNAPQRGTVTDDTGGDKKAKLDEYTRAVQAMRQQLAEANLEFKALFDTEQITNADRALARLMATERWKSWTQAQRDAVTELAKQAAELQRLAQTFTNAERAMRGVENAQKSLDKLYKDVGETLKDNREAFAQWKQDENRAIASAVGTVQAYEQQTRAIGATIAELEELELARARELRDTLALSVGYEKANEVYARHVEAIRARTQVNLREEAKAETDRIAQEAKRSFEQITDSLTDALMRGFEGGADFAKNFRETLKNLFGTLVLRPIIAPIAAGLASILGGGAGAAVGGAGGAGSGFLGLLGGGGGGIGGIPGLFPGGGYALTGLGDAVFGAGGAAAFGAGMTSPFSTLGSIASTLATGGSFAAPGLALATGLGAALPVVGGALALASAFGLFDKSVPKTGGSGGRAVNLAGGGWGLEERLFTPNDNDTSVQRLVDNVSRDFRRIAESFGVGGGVAEFLLGYDAHEEHGNRVSARSRFNGQDVFSAIDVGVGDSPEDIERGLQLHARRALLAALQASDLPTEIARVFDSVVADTATEEDIDRVLAFGTALQSLGEALDTNLTSEASRIWQESQASAVERLRLMGERLSELASEQDGSIEMLGKLTQATNEYQRAVTETLVAIRAIESAIDDMIAGTRETIEFAGLTDDQAFSLNRERGNALIGQISASDDPATIQALAERANAYFLAAFNLLDPQEQLAAKPEFLAGLSVLDDAVDAALTRIAGTIAEDTEAPLSNVSDAMTAAATQFNGAAEKMAGAADSLADSADVIAGAAAMLAGGINVNVAPQRASLVNR